MSDYRPVYPPSNFFQFDLATSTGLRVPGDLIPSSLPVVSNNTPWAGLTSIADADLDSMSV